MSSARFRFRSLSWLAVTLSAALSTASIASAQSSADDDELREPVRTPRIAVSAIMADVGQALVWDADRGEYVVLRVGSWIQGYRIRAIFPTQVVVGGKEPGQTFVFAVATRDSLGRELGSASSRGPAPSTDARAPIDPYAGASAAPRAPIPSVVAPPKSRAGAASSVPAPVDAAPSTAPSADVLALPPDPYEEPGDVGASEPARPVDPYAGPKRPTAPANPYAPAPPVARPEPGPADPLNPYDAPASPPGPVDPYGPAPAPAAEPAAPMDPYAYGNDERAVPLPPAVVGATEPAGRTEAPRGAVKKITLDRGELDGALSDFHRLSQEIALEPASEGGFKVAALDRRSYFQRIGLRKGDVILEVAGIPLRSVDDAASIYAQVAASGKFAARLVRRGKPLTIEYRFSRR